MLHRQWIGNKIVLIRIISCQAQGKIRLDKVPRPNPAGLSPRTQFYFTEANLRLVISMI
jgi:hypothetical protein